MKPIEKAVNPMKQLSIDSALAYAEKRINSVLRKLEEANWDRNAVAPYPNSNMSRADYMTKKAFYSFVQQITEGKAGVYNSCKRNEPYIVQADLQGIKRHYKEISDNAAAAFEAYVFKLEDKVGEVTEAKVISSWDLWMDSNLAVVKADGSKEIWNTKCITNYSKFGLAFNQFPTRLKK